MVQLAAVGRVGLPRAAFDWHANKLLVVKLTCELVCVCGGMRHNRTLSPKGHQVVRTDFRSAANLCWHKGAQAGRARARTRAAVGCQASEVAERIRAQASQLVRTMEDANATMSRSLHLSLAPSDRCPSAGCISFMAERARGAAQGGGQVGERRPCHERRPLAESAR